MKNLILKQGDLVKVLALNPDLEACGVKIGAVLQVEAMDGGALCIQGPQGTVSLSSDDGTLTDACDDVALHRCPITLPRGADALNIWPAGAETDEGLDD